MPEAPPRQKSSNTEQGSIGGKSCGLGTGWLSPQHAFRRRSGGFPSGAASWRYRVTIPDCHLVRTAIPPRPHHRVDSLGDFHYSHAASYPLLQTGFQGDQNIGSGLSLCPSALRSTLPTQGRLLCTQRSRHIWPGSTAMQVSCQRKRWRQLPRTQVATTKGVRLCTTAGLHGGRVGSLMPLRGALRPQAHSKVRLPPAPTPNWA